MLPSIPQVILTFAMAIAFVHFLHAGARTFVLPKDNEGVGAAVGQVVFSAGALATLFCGVYYRAGLANEIAAAVLLIVGVGLYEWARQTIVGRRFHVGFSEGVPAEVCADGPYAYVRHPIYLGYMVTFLALFVAYPNIITAILLVLTVGTFVQMALNDEKVLAGSPLAADYEVYKKRVRRFFAV